MTLILNIRGTNGSGKTTLATRLCKPTPEDKIVLGEVEKDGRRKDVHGYSRIGEYRTILLGRYETATGGCDGIPTMDAIEGAVQSGLTHSPDVLVFEGLLVSGLYQRWRDLSVTLRGRGHQYVWAFMSTPLEECIRRVIARTAKKPDWDDGNVRSKYRAVSRCRDRAILAGECVVDLDGSENLDEIRSLVTNTPQPRG